MSLPLFKRAREYAEQQLTKRKEKAERGEKVGGITVCVARAFFHGFVAGKRQLIEELKAEGVELKGRTVEADDEM